MKRVRTEQIQYAVAQYLKRRQYVDTDGSLKGAKLFQSAEEMAASLTGEHVFTCVFTFTPLHVLNSYRYCDFTYRTYRYAPLYSILYMAYIPTIVMY